ncbi:MAG: FAD-binding protein [Sideroxyarcus sp.]|nr:FAD-binding protein [Sideroxyarcus sp.]
MNPMTTDAKFLEAIAAITGGDAILTGEAAAPHCKDWRGGYANPALAVVFPADTQQVSAVVKLCAANNISIVPQGGNTSLCGSDGGNQWLVHYQRLTLQSGQKALSNRYPSFSVQPMSCPTCTR